MGYEHKEHAVVQIEITGGTDPQLRQDVDTLTSSLAQIATDASYFGVSTSNADNAPYIQALLDKGGIVNITKPGTYNTSTLYIGDNTLLNLGTGVKLRLKNGTSDYLIINKGERTEPKTRNKNIWIKGGEFDFNRVNNLKETGTYFDGFYQGHGIFFHGVDGLKITDIEKSGGATKYAFLMVDVTNVDIDNCHVINDSDGFHFQPPCKNIKLTNLTGITKDNFIAFTTGDYTNFTVSEDGNGENIWIENIHVGETDNLTNEPIRFVGAGKSGTGYYDNVVINNVVSSAYNGVPIINLMRSDTVDGNIYLTNTIIKKIKISNISSKVPTTTPLISAGSTIYNMEIDNMIVDLDATPKIFFATGGLRNLIIRNIRAIGAALTVTTPIFQFNASLAHAMKNFTLEDSIIDVTASSDYKVIEVNYTTVQQINIVNSIINFPSSKGYLFNFDNGDPTFKNLNVNISNSTITNAKNKINNATTLSFNNTQANFVNDSMADLSNIGRLRVLIASSNFLFTVNNLIAPATFSYNGLSAVCKRPVADMSPLQGDIANIWDTALSTRDIYFYNTTWKKLTQA